MKQLFFTIFLFVSTLTFSASAAPGDRDSGFTPPASLSKSVDGAVVQPDGKILIQGAFEDVDGINNLHYFVRLNSDGSRDTGFTPPTLIDWVRAIALLPDGKILIGGDFLDVNGDVSKSCLIRLNSNGTLDTTFTPPGNLEYVFSIAVLPDGKILISCDFFSDSSPRGVYRLNSSGSVDGTFTAPNPIDPLRDLVVQPDGKILIAGNFEDLGGVATIDYFGRLNANGTRDTSFTPPANLNFEVSAIALQPDGKILIGGDFDDVGGNAALDYMVRLNSNGSVDGTFIPHNSLEFEVNAIALQPDGKMIVGGDFQNIDGISTLDKVIRLNTGGSRDVSFTPPANLSRDVHSLTLQQDGKVIVGGDFNDVDGIGTLDKLIRLEGNGVGSPDPNAALKASLNKKIKKFKKAIKKAKRSGQSGKAKRFAKKVRNFQKRLRSL